MSLPNCRCCIDRTVLRVCLCDADFPLAWYTVTFGWWCIQFHRRDSKGIECQDGSCYRWAVYSHQAGYEEGKASILSVRVSNLSIREENNKEAYACPVLVFGLFTILGCLMAESDIICVEIGGFVNLWVFFFFSFHDGHLFLSVAAMVFKREKKGSWKQKWEFSCFVRIVELVSLYLWSLEDIYPFDSCVLYFIIFSC